MDIKDQQAPEELCNLKKPYKVTFQNDLPDAECFAGKFAARVASVDLSSYFPKDILKQP